MAGPWEKYQNPAWQYQSGPDPVRLEEVQRKREDQERQGRAEQRAIDAANRAADAAGRQANSDALTAQLKAVELQQKQAEAARGGKTYADATKDDQLAKKMQIAKAALNDLRVMYQRDMKGVNPLEYVDRIPANERFTAAGNSILPLIRPLVATSAKEGDSNMEMQVFQSYIPNNDDTDATIEYKMNALERLLDGMAQGSPPTQTSGQISSAIGQQPTPQQPIAGATGGPTPPSGPPSGNQGGIVSYAPPPQRFQIATGETASVEIPPELQQEIIQAVNQARANGRLTPQSYAAVINGVFQRNNYPATVDPDHPNTQTEAQALNNPKAIYGGAAPSERPTTGLERASGAVLTNPIGAGAATFLNAASMGVPEGLNPQAFQTIRDASPVGAFIGDVGGAMTGSGAIGKLAGGAAKRYAPKLLGGGKAATFGRQVAQDAAYGGAYGGAVEGDPLKGALMAGVGSGLGQVVGKTIIAPAARAIGQSSAGQAIQSGARRILPSISPNASIPKVSAADRAIIDAAGPNRFNIPRDLADAERLGVPMVLADASPGLQSLAGSVVRRSPEARGMADDIFQPRARGQIDRVGNAINRDFGPTANTVQLSDDLISQARSRSAPLYDQALNAPGATNVKIDDILGTPAGRDAFTRARQQVLNERGDPETLGFAVSANGELMPNKVPSFQTLDYVKRGFDDIINEGRNPITGQLDMTGPRRAAEGLRRDLVSRMDAENPIYAQARKAYSGPAGEREALAMGRNYNRMTPDQLEKTVTGLTPTRADQFRLGARSSMQEGAENARYSANPWEQVYGSPAAQKRAATLFPKGVGDFGRQYDLEGQLSRSNNTILGNSMTAERQLADQAFAAPPLATAGLDVLSAGATGGAPIASMVGAASRLGGSTLKDMMAVGFGKKKANALAPLLFNPNTAQAAAEFMTKEQASRAARHLSRVINNKVKRRSGLLGSGVGVSLLPATE